MNTAKKVVASNPLQPFNMLQKLVNTLLGKFFPILMGSHARTNGKAMWLPANIKLGTDKELVDAFFMSMHELAHILNKTSITGAMSHRFQKLMHDFYNSFADICDERAFERKYPGMREYSYQFYTNYNDEQKRINYYAHAAKSNGIVPYLGAFVRYLIGRVRGEELGVKNNPDNAELRADYDKYIRDLEPQINAMRKWQDASKLAGILMDRVEKLIKDELEQKAREEKKQQQKQEKQRNEKNNNNSGESDDSDDDPSQEGAGDGDGQDTDDDSESQTGKGKKSKSRKSQSRNEAVDDDDNGSSDDGDNSDVDKNSGKDAGVKEQDDGNGNDSDDDTVSNDEESGKSSGSSGDDTSEPDDGSEDGDDPDQSSGNGRTNPDDKDTDAGDEGASGSDDGASEDSESSVDEEDERDDSDPTGEESDSGTPDEGSNDSDGDDNEDDPAAAEEEPAPVGDGEVGKEESNSVDEDTKASEEPGDDELPELTDEERSKIEEDTEQTMQSANDSDDPKNTIEEIKKGLEDDFINSGEYVKSMDVVDKIAVLDASDVQEGTGVLFKESGLRLLGPEAGKMVNLFVNNTKPHTIRYQKRGRMDFRRINDPRDGLDVHLKTARGILEQSAVMLMVDHSGSMNNGGKAMIASELSSGLIYTLDRGAVPCAAFGYTDEVNYRTIASDIERNYPVRINIIKQFEEQYNGEVMKRCCAWHTAGCTPDLDAMREYAIPELLKRKEINKVLLVVCDGIPETPNMKLTDRLRYSYKKYIRAVKDAGIKVFAFGIQADLEAFFDDDWMCVDTSTLGNALIVKLGEYLNRRDA